VRKGISEAVYVRHVTRVWMLDQVNGVDFQHAKAQKASGVPTFVLQNVKDFSVYRSTPFGDLSLAKTDHREI
jgi:hypothetical protein